MTEWWTSLDLFMKILWGIAIATSLIFILETVLTFIGIDHDGSFDMDTSADGSFESEPSMNLYTFHLACFKIFDLGCRINSLIDFLTYFRKFR